MGGSFVLPKGKNIEFIKNVCIKELFKLNAFPVDMKMSILTLCY